MPIQQWACFAEAAAADTRDIEQEDEELLVPYVLVHSRTQKDVRTETGPGIESVVKSEFKDAPWSEIRDAFAKFAEPNKDTIHTNWFLILDSRALEEKMVGFNLIKVGVG
jgi:hypothetical protein